jgi:hypothetical protein
VCSNEYAQLCKEGFSLPGGHGHGHLEAFFRGHLVRETLFSSCLCATYTAGKQWNVFICWRACKALKSLVRLQAVARVRRQAEVAIHCTPAAGARASHPEDREKQSRGWESGKSQRGIGRKKSDPTGID